MAGVSSQRVYPFWILLFTLDFMLEGSGSTSGDVEKHLELGRKFLAQGQLQDALSHFHAAVEGDPDNYMTYYTRATVYLALGKSKAALPDLDKVIELKPDFTSARMQRGSVLLKLGQLDNAHIDFEMVLRKDPNNEEAMKSYSLVDPLKRDIESAYYYMERHDYNAAISLLSSSIELCPWDSKMRETRAECYIAMGDLMKAISDVRAATKLISDNTSGFLKLSNLHYELGETDESLKEIRECLRLDPDHKDCFAHYKKVKKLAKLMQDAQEAVNENRYTDCISAAEKILKVDSKATMVNFHARDKLCHCYLKNNEPDESIDNCNEALAIKEEARILCDRAEAYIGNELLDQAARDYRRALEVEENFQRAQEGLQRVQKLQKQSHSRDYYKILGVRRTASKREILKAYRKLAQKWHPDSYHGEEKKKAEKKFIDIAAAKEVLTDPEKRQKYDNGEDPLDPESQQGQGFNPFQQFQQFHGSPFSFRFHFN